ncbi:RES family NAD+ phosphorylase [Spirosoma montaniterrae]|uniref:RES domain-containing protein n=1 Tax=Spirosoma montaniterrae TaxID=1178516 RepID=A0A1P9WVU6_9BACT|nr:RES family NAD+ phosphorylase [Spirosoma montaniterrae]AQG79507.1 hypothetical protein AWR27_09355 [Spirosoma montaniterrae]
MIDVFRITTGPYANDLSGTGAKLVGGRWNRPGISVLYTSSSRALATLEVLVHAPIFAVPKDYFVLTIRLPEDSMQTVPADHLPDGWDATQPPESIKDITEEWIREGRFLVLKVPSAIVLHEYNYLVNPAHPRALEVYTLDKQPYRFDPRLMR